MFGAGPGLLASDALMLGIDPMTQRDRMAEGIDVILRLFRDETVTEKTDWYTLVNARLHLPPYTKPYPEMAVVSAVTPSGGRLAGKYDLSMICVAATNPFGYDALASNWQIACDVAAEHGRTMDPSRLRLVGPMHIAETREKAFQNARFGFERYLNYLNNNQRRFVVPAGEDPLEWFVENRYGVVGTPDDAIALIERLQAKQGEFGVFLQQAHNWADWEETKRSYELYARYVMPHFSRDNRPRASPTTGAPSTATSSAKSAPPPPARCSTSTKPSSAPPAETARRAGARHGDVASKRCITTAGLLGGGHGAHGKTGLSPASSIWRRGRSAARSSSTTRSTPRSWSRSSPAPGCSSGTRARSRSPATSSSRRWARNR